MCQQPAGDVGGRAGLWRKSVRCATAGRARWVGRRQGWQRQIWAGPLAALAHAASVCRAVIGRGSTTARPHARSLAALRLRSCVALLPPPPVCVTAVSPVSDARRNASNPPLGGVVPRAACFVGPLPGLKI